MKPGKKGIPRLIDATKYSIQGLQAAWKHEEAFRMESALALFFLPLSFWVGEDLNHQLILIISCAIVVITELLNSAIESTVDRVGAEIHPLSGQAKDIASAAVFISMLLFMSVWGMSIWQFLTHS